MKSNKAQEKYLIPEKCIVYGMLQTMKNNLDVPLGSDFKFTSKIITLLFLPEAYWFIIPAALVNHTII